MKNLRILLKKSFLFRCFKYIKKRNWRNRFLDKKYGDNRKAKNKARLAMLVYGLESNDFYRLKCDAKPWKSLHDYVSYFECTLFYGEYNSKKVSKLLCDKWLTYQQFKDFYHRAAILISKEDIASDRALGKLKEFWKTAVVATASDSQLDNNRINMLTGGGNSFIIKPLSKNKGEGISIVQIPEEAYEALKDTEGGIVEQLIVQGEELAQFNPSSVNTLRIHTVNYGDDVEVFWPCFRMGRAGKIVDNAGAGGIFAAIDVNSGATIAACDEYRNTFEAHPDSGKGLIGFVMPAWEEACKLAKDLARRVPDTVTVGWDLAWTKKGWVMVEGNAFPLIIYQIATNKGIRADFERIAKRLNAKQ